MTDFTLGEWIALLILLALAFWGLCWAFAPVEEPTRDELRQDDEQADSMTQRLEEMRREGVL